MGFFFFKIWVGLGGPVKVGLGGPNKGWLG